MSDAHGHAGHNEPRTPMAHEAIVRETTKATVLIAVPAVILWFIFAFHIPFNSKPAQTTQDPATTAPSEQGP